MRLGTPIELLVDDGADNERLDKFIRARLRGVSRGSVQRLLERGQVMVDGRRGAKGSRLRAGQRVVVAGAAADERPIPQLALQLRIVAVRPHLVVVNKPAGVACHPLVPGETDTVANALVAHHPECADASPQVREGGLVHRLDWSTSGALVAARSAEAYGHLRGLFSRGEVDKEYLALVAGRVTAAATVDQPLEPMPGDRRRMRVAERFDRGQPSLTHFEPLAQLGEHTLVRVRCKTGRRHQVRVHLAHAGHPLVGDTLYRGPALEQIDGAFLHASVITVAGERFEALLPTDRARRLRELGWSGASD